MQETGNTKIVIRWHNCICMSICICRCIKARGRQQGHYDSGGIVCDWKKWETVQTLQYNVSTYVQVCVWVAKHYNTLGVSMPT